MATQDSPERYGSVSRWLHWGIAALLAWQFAGMALKLILGRTPLVGFWVGTHASVGTLILLLVAVRILWALSQRRRRPPYDAGLPGFLAKAGHFLLYALMAIVPTLAVLRMLGGERPIRLFGIALRDAVAGQTAWMTQPANLLHGVLAWGLLALIAGHILMVLVHRYLLGTDVLPRMAGRDNGEARGN